MTKRSYILLVSILLTLSARASLKTDTISEADSINSLQGIEVTHRRSVNGVQSYIDGRTTLLSSGFGSGIHTLGESDAMRTLTMLPGYGTNSDYASGVTIGGYDFGSTAYAVDGATVFLPFHFGGIFSTFNPNHYTRTDITPACMAMGMPYRIGYVIDGKSDAMADSICGTANIGIIASNATIKIPIGSRLSLMASGRVSYINALYYDMLSDEDTSTDYGFRDLNLSARYIIDAKNTLYANLFVNRDNLGIGIGDFVSDTHLDWGNTVANIAHTYVSESCELTNRLSYSGVRSQLDFGVPLAAISMNSSVSQLSLNGNGLLVDKSLSFGYVVELSNFKPQYVTASLHEQSTATTGISAVTLSTGLGKLWRLNNITIGCAGRLAFFACDGKMNFAVDPAISLSVPVGSGEYMVRASATSQFVHFVGLSDLGMASNFWLPSTGRLAPSRSIGIDMSYAVNMPHVPVSIRAKAYAHRVLSTAQYTGDILSLANSYCDPYLSTRSVDGYNIGGDLTVTYTARRFSGWAGYGLSLFPRRYPAYPDQWLPANNEQMHSLKVYGQYRLTDRLKLSAYFTLASGRPYTPVRAVYIVAGNILTEYGVTNSARLPAYHRMDLSCTYDLPTFRIASRPISSYVNLSVINAYGHRNIEMQYFAYDDTAGTIGFKRVSSLYRFLPSLSYTLTF